MPDSQPAARITLATKVTLVRILFIPVFIVLVITYLLGLKSGNPEPTLRWWAFALFLVVATTDALDGYLARSRNEVSALGRLLDPLADKFLLLSAIILLTRPDLTELSPQIPIWFAALVVFRDALLVLGYFVVRRMAGDAHIQPRWSGKFATVLQMLAILWVLAQLADARFIWLVWAAAAFTALAGLQYAWDGYRQVADSRGR